MHGIDLIELARLAETYGDGGVRIGTDQNFIVSGVPEERLDDLLAEPLMQTYSPFPGPFERGVVACTGSEFCRFAVVETKERAVKWARALDAQLATGGDGGRDRTTPASSACTSRAVRPSCAQPQIADIGFRGDIAHVDEHIEEAVDIGLGGSLGPDAAFIDWVAGAMPVDRVPDALVRLVGRYQDERRAGEPFHLWARRTPADELAATLGGARRGGRAVKRYRIREQMNGIAEPPGKVWFWELEAGVIHADRCIECGTCVAVCPSNSIGIDEDTNLPELVKMCTGCSLCWDFCPRGGLRYEALWPPSTAATERGRRGAAGAGPLATRPTPTGRSAVARRRTAWARWWRASPCVPARQLEDVQDGGAVSALLIGLLAAGEIDGALVSKPSGDPDEQWKGVATIATTADEIRGRLGQLLQPDHGAGRARPVPLHAAGQAAHRRGRHAVRGAGPAGHAGAPLADRRPSGRRRRADASR